MTLPETPKSRTRGIIGYALPNGQVVTYEYDADRPIVPDPRHADWSTAEGRAIEQQRYDWRMDEFGIQPGEATKLTWFTRTSITTYSDAEPIEED
jgi:hypothetical protein